MIAGVLFSACLGQTCYQPATPLGAPVLPTDGPIADAGADQAVNSGDSVTLNALASYDPGGELLQYFWVQLSGPPVTLDDANSPRPTFSAMEAGIYEFVLTVIDSFGRTREDIVRIVVGDEDESAAGITVSAGDDQIAYEGETVHLVGQAQSVTGGELSYTWVQLEGPPVDLVGAAQAAASFVAPQVDVDTTLSFSFTAEDGTASAGARIAVAVLNVAETASADLALEIIATPAEPEAMEDVAFQAEAIDGALPEGTYRWDFGDGQMAEGKTATHAFSVSGTYAVSLCVTIGVGFTANVSCTEKAVTVRAAVVAGGGGGSGTTTPTTFTITGTTMDDSGAPLGGLVVAGNNGASTAVSAAATGAYEITVPRDWTGRVTPQYAGLVFTPPYRDYTSPVAADMTEQNFIATAAHNAPPVADPQSVTVAEDGSVLIVLTGSDPTGHDLTFIVSENPAHGVLGAIDNSAMGSATVAYTPMADYHGADVFTFIANNGTQYDVATVQITVTPVNDPPIATSQDIVMQANSAVAITLRGSDVDGDALTFSLQDPPAHGTITGTPPNVTYTPATDYTGTDSLQFKANDGSVDSATNGTVTVRVNPVGAWTPPIGVPEPEFGIHETHQMYELAAGETYATHPNKFYDFGDGPDPYPDAGSGPYTHYIDNTHANATDTNNVYGTPDKPRLTIPPNPAAGSVVEIHGGPYSHRLGSHMRLGGSGTVTRPIFFRGVSSGDLVRIDVSASSGYTHSATYVILEGLSIFKYFVNPNTTTGTSARYITLRHSEVRGDATNGGIGIYSGSEYWIENVVVYDTAIHDNGPWDTTEGDPDVHGIGIGQYVRHLWLVDNQIYHNGGNAIQVTGAGPAGDNSRTHHIYLGRNSNTGLPNLQSFIGIKGSSDVIVSQNHVYGQGGYRTNSAMGFQYGPERVWFLYNEIHDINGGIGCGNNSVASPGEESYFIGNLIYDIWQKPDYTGQAPDSPWFTGAMSLWGGVNRYVIGNTIHSVDAGIYAPGAGTFYVINNIVSEMNGAGAYHILLETRASTPNSIFHNNLFSQNAGTGDVRIRWGDYWGNVAAFESLTAAAQNNREGSPLFANESANDLSLGVGSPAIDAGVSAGIVTYVFDRYEQLYGVSIRKDIAGQSRPQGVGIDIGAYEHPGE